VDLRDALTALPYAVLLGVEVAAQAPDRVRLHLPYRAHHGNRNGTLHGGVLASLVTLGGALAAWTGIDAEPALEGTIVDLVVHYLAPATEEPVLVEAAVTRRGRELVFVDVGVTTGTGATVARGLVAYRPGPPSTDAAGPRVALPDLTRLRERRSGSPFTRRLGVRIADVGPGHAVALLPHQAEATGGGNRIHEGAIATLVDCAGGASAWSVDGFDPRGRAATIGMHLTYDAAPAGEDVVAVATTPWRSAGILVNAVTLTARPSGRPVATGTVTYRIVRP
jgi:uncharacterized protein (TIGR00369 family)